MAQINLHRIAKVGKSVTGTIEVPFESGTKKYDTLENADFIIPAGVYPLLLTYSPRFKKLMPLIDNVPDREGIRIHCGTVPEHSEGCVLVHPLALENIKSFINFIKKYYEDEEIVIAINGDL